MNAYMTVHKLRVYERLAANWKNCDHFGIITSSVERINDIPDHLTKLGVEDLIPFLWIDKKTNAFIYDADLGRKNPIHIVEIYYALRPQAIEWRKRGAQFALQLDDDLIYGLEDDVAVTQLAVPYGETALEEVLLYN